MNPVNAQTLAQVITTLATLVAGCWTVSRLFDYLKARLPYTGAEVVPGVPSITRKAQDGRIQETE